MNLSNIHIAIPDLHLEDHRVQGLCNNPAMLNSSFPFYPEYIAWCMKSVKCFPKWPLAEFYQEKMVGFSVLDKKKLCSNKMKNYSTLNYPLLFPYSSELKEDPVYKHA